MNKYQQNNIRLDEELKEVLKKWKDGDWAYAAGEENGYNCVDCGKNFCITRPIMKFFNWHSDKYTCYDCQNKEIEPKNYENFDEYMKAGGHQEAWNEYWQDKKE